MVLERRHTPDIIKTYKGKPPIQPRKGGFFVSQNENEYPLFLTGPDIAAILRVSKPTAYALMDVKGFPLIRIGRSKRVHRDDFFKWLSERSGQ
jgi:excisionase family DNA binding protein